MSENFELNNHVTENKKYIFFAIAVIAIYFVQSFFLPNGGIGADSLSYFEISADFPNIVTNLFPFGYPMFLKVFVSVFNDYFFGAKMLNLVLVSSILLFAYLKSFFFKETVLLFAGKTFFYVFTNVLSEGLFIFLLYFFLYFIFQVFYNSGNIVRNSVFAALLMVLMFITRYSGIYIFVGLLMFSILWFLTTKDRRIGKALLLLSILSALGVVSYLAFNKLWFDSFTGEDLRGIPEEMTNLDMLRNVFGVVNVFDPFIGIKPASSSFMSILFQGGVFVVDICLALYFISFYKKAEKSKFYYFHLVLWLFAMFYTIALFSSEWFQVIEEINTRMLAAANFCLYFSFLILFFKFGKKHEWLLWRISCFFLIFLLVYSLKDAGSYYDNRNVIKPQISKLVGKKYIFNDERNLVNVTTYEIPSLKKSFTYVHTNKQPGELKQNIVGSLNPKMKWLKEDTVKDKSKVLYTSELILKK